MERPSTQMVNAKESPGQATAVAQRSKAGWVNAVLIPVKQHLGCCVLLPLAANALGGGGAAFLASEPAEWLLFACMPPVVTFGVMKVEQTIHDYRHRKRHDCACHGKTLTRKNYLKQTGLAYVFYAASHLLTHHVRHDGHQHQEATKRVTTVTAACKGT